MTVNEDTSVLKLKDVETFQQQVLTWYDQYGRCDLPWQHPRTPYRVWLSEVMLQQTQVKTVIPYFQRFISQFATATKLAKASLDEVLHLWSGLGYYSRARNLHKSAIIINDQYHGKIPDQLTLLQQLPGIGRSTAGAILSLAFNQRAAILDGNVKRVLCRYYAIDAPINTTKTLNYCWHLAETLAPKERACAYTQAMMDLGAIVCTKSQPKCAVCPLKDGCKAYQLNKQQQIPYKNPPKKLLPIKTTVMVVIENNLRQILLCKRPAYGIWGGLWSLPECGESFDEITSQCHKLLAVQVQNYRFLSEISHNFSHFRLIIKPVLVQLTIACDKMVMENDQQLWYTYDPDELVDQSQTNNRQRVVGLPKPVKTILSNLIIKKDKNATSLL